MMTMHNDKASNWEDTDVNVNVQRQGWGLVRQNGDNNTDCYFTTNTYHYM